MKRKKAFPALVFSALLFLSGCAGPDLMAGSSLLSRHIDDRIAEVKLSYDRIAPMSESVCLLPSEDAFSESAVAAEYAGLFAEDDCETLYGKNPTKKLYPASVTKLMTALLVLENITDMDREVVVTEEAFADLSADASLADLRVGYSYSISDLLYGLLLPSGNEAANVLAKAVSGSVEAFVARMNRRAMELGMVNTSFRNPHGLHNAQHYTTVYDLYLLFREVASHEEFTTVTQTKSIEITGRRGEETVTSRITTTNAFVREFVLPPEGISIQGGKTGYTVQAGRCLALICTDRAGKRYFSIIGKAKTYEGVYEDMNALLAIAAEHGNE